MAEFRVDHSLQQMTGNVPNDRPDPVFLCIKVCEFIALPFGKPGETLLLQTNHRVSVFEYEPVPVGGLIQEIIRQRFLQVLAYSGKGREIFINRTAAVPGRIKHSISAFPSVFLKARLRKKGCNKPVDKNLRCARRQFRRHL